MRIFALTRERAEAATYLIGMLLQRGSLFLFLPILLSHLSVVEYGVFGLLQSFVTLLPGILSLNLPATVTRLYYDPIEEAARKGIATRIILYALASSVTVVVLMVPAVIHFRTLLAAMLELAPHTAVVAILMALAGAVGSAQLQAAYGFWRAERRPLMAAGINLAGGAVFLLTGFLFYSLGRLNLTTAIIAYAGTMAAVGIAGSLLAVSWRHIGSCPRGYAVLRNGLRYGIPMLPYILGLWALSAGGRWITRAALDLRAVGEFTLATQLATMIGLLGRSAYEAWAPRSYELFARDEPQQARAYLALQGRRTLAVVAFCGLTTAVVLQMALPRIAPEYGRVASIFPIVLIGALFDVAYLRYHTELLGRKLTGTIGLYTTISVLLFFTASWILSRALGIHGIALAYALAFGQQFLFARFTSRRAVVDRSRMSRGEPGRSATPV